MEMKVKEDFERFGKGADKYAAYLETPEGRLRLDLPLANLQEFLPQQTGLLCALDLGGGTGANAVRLARLGFQVTLLDVSLPMLDHAEIPLITPGQRARVSEAWIDNVHRGKAESGMRRRKAEAAGTGECCYCDSDGEDGSHTQSLVQ